MCSDQTEQNPCIARVKKPFRVTFLTKKKRGRGLRQKGLTLKYPPQKLRWLIGLNGEEMSELNFKTLNQR